MLKQLFRILNFFKLNVTSFRSRIILSVVAIALLMTVFAYLFVGQMTQITKQNESIVTIYQPIKVHSFATLQGVNQVINILQSNVYTSDQRISRKVNEDIMDIWARKVILHHDSLTQAVERRTEPELLVTYEAINDRIGRLSKSIREAIKINNEDFRKPLYLSDVREIETDTSVKVEISSNKVVTIFNDQLAFLLTNDIVRVQNELNIYYDQLIAFNNKATGNLRSNISTESTFFTRLQILSFVIATTILILLIYTLNKYIKSNIETLNIQASKLAQGDLPEIVHSPVAELEVVAESLNDITKNLQNLKKFASAVGKGKFESNISIFGTQGEVGVAISQMRDGLLSVSKEDETRTWRNTGLTKFSEILRRESNDLDRLSQQLVSELIKYIGANQGGFFIVNDEEINREPYLELISAYAYNKKKYIEKRVLKGQSLIGRVWKEGLSIYLTEVPDNYIEIRTGLGGANPRYIFIVPLKINEEIQGVLEIASFEPIEDYKKEFIEQVADSVASTYSSSKVSRRTKILLEDSQRITLRMREQEEELRQNIEEMQSTQEEMQKNQRELSEKEGNMRALLDNASDSIMAFNHNLKVTVINKSMKNLYESIGIYLDLGRNVEDAFPGRSIEQMKEEFKKVLSGERFTTYSDVVIRGVTYYYEILYNPIYNERQRVVGASVFITDITQEKVTEVELKAKEANLKSLINNTEDSIMAIDKNYRILVYNEVFKKRRKEFDFKEGDNIFNTIPEYIHEEWKKYYDRALRGERFEKVIKREMDNKKTQYREHSFNPILNEQGETIGVSVFAKDITEAKLAEAENQRIMATMFEKQKQDKRRLEELEKEIKQLSEKS